MYRKHFSELSNRDAAIAGGKGASLGEMTNAGIPVPPGFVVLADAFEKFLDETNLNTEIDAILHTVKTDEMRSVEHASERIQKLILEAKMPEDIGEEIVADFSRLDAEHVAVRSSATAEDSDSAAWAGQLDTYLNTTRETLLANVQRCWASLFTSRAIFYRFEKDLHTTKISVAVVVQKMIQSEVSGIAFSVHPVTEDRNQLIIEAGFGLGEAIVSGQITPDSYVVEKSPRRIIDKNIVEQERGIYRKETGEMGGMGEKGEMGANEWRNIPIGQRSEQKLSDEQILALSQLIIHIEQHYGFPCDIEWAFEAGILYITQSRPITTLSGGQSDGLPHQNDMLPPSSSESVVLSKIYTRERPLFYFSVFPDGERSGIRKYFDRDIEDILVIFPPKNRPGEVWYPKLFLREIELSGAEKMKRDPALTRQVIIDADVAWEKLVPYLINDQPIRNIEEANSYYQYLVDFWKVLNTIFFFLVDKNELSREFSESLLALRDKTQHYTAKMSTVFLNFIDTQYPDFSSVSSYMMPGEVSELSEDSTATALLMRLRDRAREGCFIYRDVLYPLSQLEVVLIQNNFVFEQEHNVSDSQIQGQVAYQGKAVGRVRNIRSRADLGNVNPGDILVAPITDAHSIQAMQRAGAFVTDEGGIMCHAAIVAREMKKPCIIGTKIATQVLHDGDLVEVDADNGVVRILERTSKEERINTIVLKKNYSRDLSLILEQLWVSGFKRMMLKYPDYKNPYEPYVIFFVNGENMEIWENERAIHFFQNWLLEKNKQGTTFLQEIIHEYEGLVSALENYWRDGGVSDHTVLKKYLEISERAAGLFFVWYYTGTDDRTPEVVLKLARGLRAKDEFFAKNDKYIKESVTALGGKVELANLISFSEFPGIPSEEVLRQRISGIVVVDGDKRYFSPLIQFSEDHPEYEFDGLQAIVVPVDTFSGQAAQKGKAKGFARIVKNQRNMERVHVGDIIVSPMTTPDFLPAMQKAIAFITDEGGITCHAAIVAREMKKPCIIGTKIATQVLKDGDLVEVDADNGVVRILERA